MWVSGCAVCRGSESPRSESQPQSGRRSVQRSLATLAQHPWSSMRVLAPDQLGDSPRPGTRCRLRDSFRLRDSGLSPVGPQRPAAVSLQHPHQPQRCSVN